MSFSSEMIERQLMSARVLLVNTRANPDIRDALAAHGFTAERLDEGEILSNNLSALCQHKINRYGGLRGTTNALGAAGKQAQQTYRAHITLARVAFQSDQGTLQALHLLGPRKRTLAGWLGQARDFYATALATPAIAARLAEFTITREQLEAGVQLMDAVREHHAASLQQRGLAQESTYERDLAAKELKSWISDFKLIARVALKSRPQLLEQFGIFVRS
ncbi:hypothetical protein SE17_33335 [Kouleothrix aurantiaca]|uniref:Uncharacterized protein n=1 Tax=Kouleothrix aurantiaca TaxID=186479 RepID=A0A0P9H601_9CHLR|nr:hypothetical protein SE17_33335 [Kouleothrix aurantiaca]